MKKTCWHLEQRTLAPFAGIFESSKLNFVIQEAQTTIIGVSPKNFFYYDERTDKNQGENWKGSQQIRRSGYQARDFAHFLLVSRFPDILFF